MGAEDGPASERNLIEFLDENSPAAGEVVNNVAVVNDLFPHIDRRAVDFQRELDDVNRAHYPGAKPSRLEQVDDFFSAGGRRRRQM